VEIVVGGDGGSSIATRGEQAGVGGAKLVQGRRLERRRLSHGEALHHDDRRIEPARLDDGERRGTERVLRHALDEPVALERRECRRDRRGPQLQPRRDRVDIQLLAGRQSPDQPPGVDFIRMCRDDRKLRRPGEDGRQRDTGGLLGDRYVVPQLEHPFDMLQRLGQAAHCLCLPRRLQ